jgi:hypothetical protein
VIHKPGVHGDLIATEGNTGHTLGSSGDDYLCGTPADAIYGERDGLETGGAVAIDGHGRGSYGQTGAKACDAGDVHSLLGFGHGASEDYIFDLGLIELREPLQSTADGEGRKVIGAGGAEGSSRSLAYRCADCGGDDDFVHCFDLKELKPLCFIFFDTLDAGPSRDHAIRFYYCMRQPQILRLATLAQDDVF